MVTTPGTQGSGWIGRAHSRRAVLAAATVSAGLLAAGAAAGTVLLRRGGDGAAPSPTPATPVPASPTGASTATPSPTSTPGLALIEPAPGAFERRVFAEGERIPWHEGVFFMDTASGAITAYRRAQPSAGDVVSMAMLHGERWLSAQRSPEDHVYLLDRDTGTSWRYPAARLTLRAASPSTLVFAVLAENAQRSVVESGEYLYADAGMAEVRRLTLPGVAGSTRWFRRGEVFAVTYKDAAGAFQMAILDAGTMRDVRFPEVEGKQTWYAQLEPDARGGFLGLLSYYAVQGGGQPVGEPLLATVRISLAGEVTGFRPADGFAFESGSPDGRFVAEEVTLFQRPAIGEGSGERWTAVTLADAAGVPVFRLRSAALRYGDNLPPGRWLADGSGFVAQLHGEAGRPYDVTYAVIGLDGAISPLPRVPVAGDQWFRAPRNLGPLPSPADPDLFSFGRFYLYNRRTGRWFIPNLEDEGGPAHWGGDDAPWDGRPGEMVFALGHGGHGGLMSPVLVEPLLERPPFAEAPPLRFRVRGTGSCLNLRSAPSASAPVVGCLADGTVLTLDPEGERLWEGVTQAYSTAYDDTGAWVLVGTASGARGWVSADYLAWAP